MSKGGAPFGTLRLVRRWITFLSGLSRSLLVWRQEDLDRCVLYRVIESILTLHIERNERVIMDLAMTFLEETSGVPICPATHL